MKDTLFVIGEAVSILAMCFSIFSFQMKSRKGILFMQMSGNVLWTTSFLLMGTLSGAVMNFIAFIRALVFSFKDKKWASGKWLLYFFIVIVIIAGIGTTLIGYNMIFFENGIKFDLMSFDFGYRFIIDLFPTIGSLFCTLSFYESEEQKVRRLSLIGSPFWLVYDAFSLSIGGTLNEIFVIISIIIALYRFRDKKEVEKDL